ncbi:MAG: DUF2634 domain-containing protein [Lachnospiraceae bacterium]|jgi:phage baseplate assembly protein W|nr:DUF2634 domain-containing protein [Lachnospiraceae bacterium]GFI02301.1 hypothetical protein IMSAGC005_01129 [Lachnospiraceae bacterium]
MIPKSANLPGQDFVIEEQPTYTYKMDPESGLIRGYVDGIEAMEQAVYKILSTERYRYLIYSWNYGIELEDLFGQPVSYACPELERRIREALIWDGRIEEVGDFKFDTSVKGIVHVYFTAHTILGDIKADKEVRI